MFSVVWYDRQLVNSAADCAKVLKYFSDKVPISLVRVVVPRCTTVERQPDYGNVDR